LDAARARRIDADYDLAINFVPEFSAEMIGIVDEIRSKIEQLSRM
jgi:hypothetical protein